MILFLPRPLIYLPPPLVLLTICFILTGLLLFLEQLQCIPASVPLLLLFPPLEMFFFQVLSWLHNATSPVAFKYLFKCQLLREPFFDQLSSYPHGTQHYLKLYFELFVYLFIVCITHQNVSSEKRGLCLLVHCGILRPRTGLAHEHTLSIIE